MEVNLIVEGMTCAGCEKAVRAAIMQTQAVSDALLDRHNNRATIVFKANHAQPAAQADLLQEIIANIESSGFDCRLPGE